MRKLALAAVAVAALAACPEQRPAPPPRTPRPPSAALAAGIAAQVPGAADVLSLRRPEGPEWFGLYLVGKKAGYTKVALDRETRDGKEVLVGRSDTLLRATVGGQEVERRQSEERVYEARPGGRLLSFRASWAGDGGARTLEGTCTPAGCRAVYANGDGTRQEKALPPVDETADQADGVRLAAARRATIRGAQLDLDKLRVRQVQDVFVGRDTVAGGGVETAVSVIAESEVGDRIAAQYKVADDGRVVEIRLGDAVVARPEPETTARRLDKVDLFALARVQLPSPLPRGVPATIVYRFQGLPPAFRTGDARQQFATAAGGEAVLTVTVRQPLAADPRKDTPLAKARVGASAEDLQATPQIDADAPQIVELARTVAGDAGGAYAAAVKLSQHVYRRLEKAYGASHDRATEVLAAGKGDCTEHTLLTVALARALGIPARPVHGLVYARYDDGVPALYWHAWVEVRSAGEWIAIDPTFGQPVADATHVALGSGEQVDTVGLLGALKVSGVEVKRAASL